jgi:hypothetical protein
MERVPGSCGRGEIRPKTLDAQLEKPLRLDEILEPVQS